MASFAENRAESRRIDELKEMLFSDSDSQQADKITKCNPLCEESRAFVWKVCLEIDDETNNEELDEIFDLPEQSLIREHCQNLVSRLGNEEEDKLCVISDLESVITKFIKLSGQRFSPNKKWLDILAPLVALHLPKTELFKYFNAIQKCYIPRCCPENGNPFHLLRLLLLYHEPELCSFLDTKKIPPDSYAVDWFSSLFSSTCGLSEIQMMWDIYFQFADPFFVFFLSLVLIINAKEQLLEMKEEGRLAIIDTLSNFPSRLELDDVKDFCYLASHYASSTPRSFVKEYSSLIFGDNSSVPESPSLSQALCLPVSIEDLVSRNNNQIGSSVKFFVVDCRPADQYNSGHLSNAFHLEASLMLQEPAVFTTAVEALLAAKDQSFVANSMSTGNDICFMGSGREEEDQYVHMVIASFLQKHQKYVSLAMGGYSALHDLVKSNIDFYLTCHCQKTCLMCTGDAHECNGEDEKEVSIIDKVTTAFKNLGMRDKLLEYIVNSQQSSEDRHVSSSDRVGKRYRSSASLFSIDDDEQEDGDKYTQEVEEVNIELWQKKPGVIGTFQCDSITDSGARNPSHLIITNTHMYILRINPQRKGYAFIVARRNLAHIIKITSKKRCPECISFKYGTCDQDEIVISDVDYFYIPKASDAIYLIKYHICGNQPNSSKR